MPPPTSAQHKWRAHARLPRIQANPPMPRKLTAAEGRQLLDEQARKFLGISGEEFLRRYDAGELNDLDRDDVLRVAMLIPFAR
jgi:hypothetical protein